MERRLTCRNFAIIAALSAVSYGPVLDTYFLSDDFALIGRVAQEGLFATWGRTGAGFLRPIIVLSYYVDYCAWGFNPIGFHLTNVVFHSISGIATYLLARRLLQACTPDRHQHAALLAACLFVVLPSHSESVTWIAGRTDVIASAFGILATVCFVRTLERWSPVTAALALMLLLISFFAKECAIALPPIWVILALMYHFFAGRRITSRTLIVLAGGFTCLAGYLLARKMILGVFVGGYGSEHHLSLMQAQSVSNLIRCLARTLVPALPLRTYAVANHPMFSLCLGLFAGSATTFFFTRREYRRPKIWGLIASLAACVLLALVPTLTIQISIFSTENERFLYLSSAFTCILIAALASAALPNRRMCTSVMVILILTEGAALYWVNTRWVTASRLSQQIAREVARHDPGNTLILNLPDNFRGAYVFRNGLDEAATIFQGSYADSRFRVLCKHDLDSLWQSHHVATRSDRHIVLTLPSPSRIREVASHDLHIEHSGTEVSITHDVGFAGAYLRVIAFRGGLHRPMLVESSAWPSEPGAAVKPQQTPAP